jgi:hypothetical protein
VRRVLTQAETGAEMTVLVVVVSIFAVGMGAFGLVSPPGMAAFALRWRSRAGLWTASIGRLVIGVALWIVAPTSRTPVVLQVLAVLSMLSALVLPLLGVSRFESILSWWSRQSPGFIRSWSALAVVLGIFLLWSVVA